MMEFAQLLEKMKFRLHPPSYTSVLTFHLHCQCAVPLAVKRQDLVVKLAGGKARIARSKFICHGRRKCVNKAAGLQEFSCGMGCIGD